MSISFWTFVSMESFMIMKYLFALVDESIDNMSAG